VEIALVAFIHKGRVFLHKRLKPPEVGSWEFPGGKIEEGENPLIAACREVEEELGVLILPEQLTYFGSDEHALYGKKTILKLFICPLWLNEYEHNFFSLSSDVEHNLIQGSKVLWQKLLLSAKNDEI
jgi:mutator protein MutT